MPEERTLQQIINILTWEDIVADGFITVEQIEADLRAKGLGPYEGYEDMYD